MRSLKRESFVDQIYNQLRNSIITLSIPLGSRLNIADLQNTFHVSSTPIREALNRLQVEGLVTYESNIGARVITLDAHDATYSAVLAGDVERIVNIHTKAYQHVTETVIHILRTGRIPRYTAVSSGIAEIQAM